MGSAEKLITENLDVWSSAIEKKTSTGRGSSKKIDLYGIAKLRELILELAVRGLLVSQDTSDESAKSLIEKIRPATAKIAAEGKFSQYLRREKTGTTSLPSIPDSWVWCELGEITAIARGGSPRPIKSFITEEPNGLNWIKIGDSVRGSRYITGTAQKIRPEGLLKTRQVFSGDLILSNSMSFGYPYILKIDGCIHDGWLVLRLPELLMSKLYLCNLLLSPYVKRAFTDSASGAVVQNLNADKVKALAVPLPPLAEQHRIVAKVDELMDLCDQLEQQQEASISAHETLVETLLAALTNAADKGEFNQAWERIAEHFDTLFTTEHSVDQLKQTILQLAVMGKLVRQNPDDEPASVLLEKIAAEKAQLIKDGKIKKQKALPGIGEGETPFELPSGWEWLRFNEVINQEFPISYGVLVPGPDVEGGIPFVRIGDIDLLNPPNLPEKCISMAIDKEYQRTRLVGGELLMAVVGSVGKLGIVPDSWIGANIARALCRIMPNEHLNKEYLLLLLQSEFMQMGFLGDTRTVAQPTLNIGLIRRTLTPVAPIMEQHRIVAKVGELVGLCDGIKVGIKESQVTKVSIADAMTAQMTV